MTEPTLYVPNRQFLVTRNLGSASPTAFTGAAASASATPGVFGNWTMSVISQTTSGAQQEDFLLFGLVIKSGSAPTGDVTYVDAQLGWSPSTAAEYEILAEFRALGANVISSVGHHIMSSAFWLPYPIYVPAIQNLSYRVASSTASYQALLYPICTRISDLFNPRGAPVDISKILVVKSPGYRMAPTATNLVSVTSGSAGAFGSWTELINSMPCEGLLTARFCTPGSTNPTQQSYAYSTANIGIGPSGSESIVYMDNSFSAMWITAAGVCVIPQTHWIQVPVYLPRNERVAVQALGATASVNTNEAIGYIDINDIIPLEEWRYDFK